MSFYRRRLPHWQPRGKALFVTWRLHKSLAQKKLLVSAELAGIEERSILFAAENRHWFDLHAYVIMPNHVHVLIDTLESLEIVFQSIKRFSAREANAVLGRTGQPFWQEESFDHWMRDEQEFRVTARYIEQNPVRAGLVERATEYRWSSAWRKADTARA